MAAVAVASATLARAARTCKLPNELQAERPPPPPMMMPLPLTPLLMPLLLPLLLRQLPMM